MTDFNALTDAELAAKLRWYEARGDRFDGQIALIRNIQESRAEAAAIEAAKRGSVVKGSYKAKYRERNAGRDKTMQRGCGDWLHGVLAAHTLNDEGKLDVALFEAVLDANRVKHAHWNRTTPGWQGRLRMTGRLALQRVVAEAEAITLPDGSELDAPAAWVERTIR